MTIETRPLFYYVGQVTASNSLLNFEEPSGVLGEQTASLRPGSRTITKLLNEVSIALNDTGEQSYTVSLDRDTRLVTISSSDTFNLLVATGSNVGLGCFTLLGFTGTDRTGASSYVSDTPIGTAYKPQFIPQRFLAFEDNLEGIDSSINESASGVTEVITFGDKRFMEMNIKYITSNPKTHGHPINNNTQALEEARLFLEFLIKKGELEFMIDSADVNTFSNVLLESTPKSRTGTSFELRELVSQGLNGYYETGNLKFRKVS